MSLRSSGPSRGTWSRTQHSNCYAATLRQFCTTGHVHRRVQRPYRHFIYQSAEVCKQLPPCDKTTAFSLSKEFLQRYWKFSRFSSSNSGSNKAQPSRAGRDNPETLRSSISITALNLMRAAGPLLHKPVKALMLCCTTTPGGRKQSCTALSMPRLGRTQTSSRYGQWPVTCASFKLQACVTLAS